MGNNYNGNSIDVVATQAMVSEATPGFGTDVYPAVGRTRNIYTQVSNVPIPPNGVYVNVGGSPCSGSRFPVPALSDGPWLEIPLCCPSQLKFYSSNPHLVVYEMVR